MQICVVNHFTYTTNYLSIDLSLRFGTDLLTTHYLYPNYTSPHTLDKSWSRPVRCRWRFRRRPACYEKDHNTSQAVYKWRSGTSRQPKEIKKGKEWTYVWGSRTVGSFAFSHADSCQCVHPKWSTSCPVFVLGKWQGSKVEIVRD